MCELLGLSFNRPVRCGLSFRGFRHRGTHNPHGWGVARYEGPACQVLKEPGAAGDSGLARFLRDYEAFRSTLLIAHVRWASRGAPALKNTHPFARTFRARDVVLAHNGTLADGFAAGPVRFHPVGDTDSELLLCTLLGTLSERRIGFADHAQVEALLRELNDHGRMNLLFSEGERLFAYRDRDASGPGLFLARRRAPFSAVRLEDEDWQVDLAEEKRPGQRGCVVATRPLTDEPWAALECGALVVLKDGELVYGRGPGVG
jgi:predicted glutamine amidotransferase